MGYGCTTCIGNSGPLPDAIRQAAAAGTVHPVAVLSGNRNFAGRVHPDLDLGFIMSPPLVIAFALAGDASRNLRDEPVQTAADGSPVMLRDLWPTDEEIEAHLAQGLDAADFRRDFEIAERNPEWHALAAPQGDRFPWNPASTILRRPPFASVEAGSMLGRYSAHPLLVLGDDITTDHISPASAIPRDSLVADFLVERGDDRNDLNVFASRRGNWEVMLRAAFHSKSLVNLLCPGVPVAHTVHAPSGDVLPIWEVAQRYRDEGEAVVLVAGERYGTGSSRDWAAKGQRLLGVRAVLAASFERIHRSNLIGMGILPLRLPGGDAPAQAEIAARGSPRRRGAVRADHAALRGGSEPPAGGRHDATGALQGGRRDAVRGRAAPVRWGDPGDLAQDDGCDFRGLAEHFAMRLEQSIAARIIELIQAEGLPVGSHLPAQMLADRLRVSRSPVNEALAVLHEKGVLRRQPNRGYFLAKPLEAPAHLVAGKLRLGEPDEITKTYYRIADDRLRGLLPDEFSEALLKKRYELSPAQLDAVLSRVASEGWAEKKPGYGWVFSPMLTTPDSLLQSYRMRLALEPAALLEPGYRLERSVIARCRAAEQHLLDGGIETDTAEQLHDRGVRFHEALVEASGNPFFIDAIRRVNRVRRLLSYRSMQDRKRYRQHCLQHLQLLELLERGRNEDASKAMREHLESTLRNIEKIRGILKT